MKVAVCGLGKLGCCVAATFAAAQVPVTGFDIDRQKMIQLRKGLAPVQEPNLPEYLASSQVKSNLQLVWNTGELVHNSDACFFVTPTPSNEDGSFNHTFLIEALTSVARDVERQKKGHFLFIITSTVVPGFMDREAASLLRRILGDLPFHLVYKPELIAIGSVIENLQYPDLLIIGESSQEAGQMVEDLFRQMIYNSAPAKRMPMLEAELAKISLNCAVTMKISFANQLGIVATRLGADPHVILDAIGTDERIGHRALKYGMAFGGPCFPRDNRMFQYVASQVGERAHIAEATDAMNRRVLRFLLESIPVSGDVGILGLSYKPGTALTEESPGRWLRHALMSSGRRAKAYDPLARSPNTLDEVLQCPVVIVATAHPEFSTLHLPKSTLLLDPMGVVKEIAVTEEVA